MATADLKKLLDKKMAELTKIQSKLAEVNEAIEGIKAIQDPAKANEKQFELDELEANKKQFESEEAELLPEIEKLKNDYNEAIAEAKKATPVSKAYDNEVYDSMVSDYKKQIGKTVYHWSFGPLKVEDVKLRDNGCPLVVCEILDSERVRFPLCRPENRVMGTTVEFQIMTADLWLMDRPQDVVNCAGFNSFLCHGTYANLA